MTTDEMRKKLEELPPTVRRKKELPQDQRELLVEYWGKRALRDLCEVFGCSKDILYREYREEMKRREHASSGK